jgi:hypothetical protein
LGPQNVRDEGIFGGAVAGHGLVAEGELEVVVAPYEFGIGSQRIRKAVKDVEYTPFHGQLDA